MSMIEEVVKQWGIFSALMYMVQSLVSYWIEKFTQVIIALYSRSRCNIAYNMLKKNNLPTLFQGLYNSY